MASDRSSVSHSQRQPAPWWPLRRHSHRTLNRSCCCRHRDWLVLLVAGRGAIDRFEPPPALLLHGHTVDEANTAAHTVYHGQREFCCCACCAADSAALCQTAARWRPCASNDAGRARADGLGLLQCGGDRWVDRSNLWLRRHPGLPPRRCGRCQRLSTGAAPCPRRHLAACADSTAPRPRPDREYRGWRRTRSSCDGSRNRGSGNARTTATHRKSLPLSST